MPLTRRSASGESLRQLADEDLMPLVQAGEARGFEVLYERHATAAFSLAYRMCGSRGLAEDVTQEAFLAVWRSGARYDRARGSVRTWLLGIVRNRAIDLLRHDVLQPPRLSFQEGIEEQQVSAAEAERTEAAALRREAAREV